MITWNTDANAPCCPGEIVNDDGRTLLVQTDCDYPGTARSFGWSLQQAQRCRKCGKPDNDVTGVSGCRECGADRDDCDHNSTDGTVDCPDCGVTAGQFIAAAYEWLRDNDGATADDPGYFDSDPPADGGELPLSKWEPC